MANITVRKEGANLPARREIPWSPLRAARELLGWDPFQEMATLFPQRELIEFSPAFEVKERKDAYLFRADLPGVDEDDVDITRIGNRLTVSGKREAEKEESGETYYAYERTYGNFTRSFTLPEGVDDEHIHAELKDGVLSIAVPKRSEAQPKRIALQKPAEKKA